MSTNIFIAGAGGQGLITLKKILTYASLKEGKFFRASELRGLAQRGGEVNVHFRLGEIYSPLIGEQEADLIIGLDLLEAARGINFASEKTCYLVNDYFIPFFQLSEFSKDDFLKIVSPITKNIFVVEAGKICEEKLKSSVYESAFMLGFAFAKNLLRFKKDSLIFGIKKSAPSKFVKENIEAFNLGEKNANVLSAAKYVENLKNIAQEP